MRRHSLLLTVIATLVVTALLPLGISSLLLRTNRDALEEQVQRTHMVAASSSAARVDAYFSTLLSVARATAGHPAILLDPRSPTSQELLRGILQTHDELAAVGLYSAAGDKIVQAQVSEYGDELANLELFADADELAVLVGESRRWLRVRHTLTDGAGTLVLLAHAEPLDRMVQARVMGAEAQEILATRDGQVVAGSHVTLQSFPSVIVERARSGKLAAESGRYSDPLIDDQIVGFAPLQTAPWYVLSRQPARSAEIAQQRVWRATWIAAGGALGLTVLLSVGAYFGLVRPLRRLVAAGRQLAGGGGPGDGSEISQLQASFEVLQKRLQESEELDDVFLGRYEVKSMLGTGAMGSVFRGWDPALKRRVALKTVRLTGENIDSEKLARTLKDEAAISARFNHPNIVTIYDLVTEGQESAFIAMEYVEGVSLDAYLWDRGSLPPEQVIPLGVAIARALALSHANDLVHHDVKPGNVLIGKDGSIKVTDFGISQLISAASRTSETVCGTPGYLAPECLQGEGYTPKSDLFSFGIILYEALTGRHPFFGRNFRETMINTLVQDPKPLESLVPDIPYELSRLVTQLLAKEPSDRLATADEALQSLETMAQERGLEWQLSSGTMARLSQSTESQTSKTHTQLLNLAEVRG